MDDLEDRVEDELGGDAEFESAIEAIVGALEPIEESDAVEVLASWKQTRTATNQEKLNRDLRTPVYQHSNSTSIARNFPKPDLAKFACRIRWYICLEVGLEVGDVGRNCPKKRPQASGGDAGTTDVVSVHESHLEKLVRQEKWRKFQQIR